MTMSDPIADMLTRIRNANTAKHDTVDIPASKIKNAMVEILYKEGYIEKYEIIEEGSFNTIRVTLKYGADKNEKIITGLKRISKPGLRVYAGKNEIPKVHWRSGYRYPFHKPGYSYRQRSKKTSGRRRSTGFRLVGRKQLNEIKPTAQHEV